MTRPKRKAGYKDRRSRITHATVAGLVAGGVRAFLDILLRHLTAGC